MKVDLLKRGDIRHCLKVAAASRSNLWLVGRLLTPARRAFFAAAYASMRVVDDFVDDDFLQRPANRRESGREAALATVDSWRRASVLAHAGEIAEAAPFDTRLFSALAATLGASDLGPLPWERMAAAMARDVREEPFDAWEDFIAYCEGATVAPASVFLYVLAMRGDAASGFRSGLPGLAADPAPVARDMGIFCYLVHILRDLRKDAGRGEVLLTVPNAILADHGLDRVGLAAGARSGRADGLIGLVEDLAQRAVVFREGAAERRGALNECLDRANAKILDGLLAVYSGLHDRVLKDPAGVIERPDGFGDGVRRKILSAAGLAV